MLRLIPKVPIRRGHRHSVKGIHSSWISTLPFLHDRVFKTLIFLITKFAFVVTSLGNSEKNKKGKNHFPTLLTKTVLPAPLTLCMQGCPLFFPDFTCLIFSVSPAESLMENLITGCASALLKALHPKNSLTVHVVWGRALMDLRGVTCKSPWPGRLGL